MNYMNHMDNHHHADLTHAVKVRNRIGFGTNISLVIQIELYPAVLGVQTIAGKKSRGIATIIVKGSNLQAG